MNTECNRVDYKHFFVCKYHGYPARAKRLNLKPQKNHGSAEFFDWFSSIGATGEAPVLHRHLPRRFFAIQPRAGLIATLPLSDDIKDDMKEMSATIMDMLGEQSSLTQNGVTEKLAVSVCSVSRVIKDVVETKRIIRAGGRKSGHWRILAKRGENNV